MTYYVYENWRADGHKAKIHLATCPYCNDGKGIHPGSSNKNGQWHGPYNDFQFASDKAQRVGTNVSVCKHCLPQ